MAIEHLDVLKAEIPEIFQPRDLSPTWDDDFIIVPIDDPEWNHPEQDENAIAANNDQFPPFDDLESILGDSGLNQVDVPVLSSTIVEILGGAHAGAPVPYVDLSKMPPPDCLAFYLPFHYYHPTWWGVYILLEGVQWLAAEIVRRTKGSVSMRTAIRSARLFLYYHEAFHHKTECFATRMELTHRKPFYKTGFERLYQNVVGTIDCREEGLANASALKDTYKATKNLAIDQALVGYVKDSPPGYDQGEKVRNDFYPVRNVFAEENQQTCLPHLPKKNPEIWHSATHMFDGISNIKGRVNYVIPRSSPLAARLPFRPLLPPSKLIKKLKELAKLEFVRNGGNHDIYRAPSGKIIPIPRHPRDLGRGLVQKIIREAGLDLSLQEFLDA